MKRLMKCLVPLAVLALCATMSYAGTLLCYESDSGQTAGDYGANLQIGGCATSIPGTSPTLYVASDGTVSFDPFGVRTDTSDDIMLNSSWVQGGSMAWTLDANLYVWYLPYSGARPSADEGAPEVIGEWYYPGASWSSAMMGAYLMIDADNVTQSDIITLDNNGPSGAAEITFQSGTPEPGTLGLLGLALGAAAVVRRLKKRPA